jgi:hypothetical protein
MALTKHELIAVQVSAGVSVAILLWTMQGKGERRAHEWRSRFGGRVLELTLHAFPANAGQGYHAGYMFDLRELENVPDVWQYAAAAFQRVRADLERMQADDEGPAAMARAREDFAEQARRTGYTFGGTDI